MQANNPPSSAVRRPPSRPRSASFGAASRPSASAKATADRPPSVIRRPPSAVRHPLSVLLQTLTPQDFAHECARGAQVTRINTNRPPSHSCPFVLFVGPLRPPPSAVRRPSSASPPHRLTVSTKAHRLTASLSHRFTETLPPPPRLRRTGRPPPSVLRPQCSSKL